MKFWKVFGLTTTVSAVLMSALTVIFYSQVDLTLTWYAIIFPVFTGFMIAFLSDFEEVLEWVGNKLSDVNNKSEDRP